MGTKRSYEEVESVSDGSGSGSDSETASKRPKHQEGTLGRSRSKKRVRTIKKQLDHDENLAADVRIELRRELAVHEAAIAEHAFRKKRSAAIAKYHMVRFFERKKAMRLAKRLKKQLDKATDAEEVNRLKQELHVAEVDEAYAQYSPLAETYISLYPKSNTKAQSSEQEEETPAADALLQTERPPVWTTIEEALKEGSQALAKVRDRKEATEGQEAKKTPPQQQQQKQRQKTHKEDKRGSSTSQGGRKGPAASMQDTSGNYPPIRPPAVVPGGRGTGQSKAPAMNRRERRRLMREMEEEEKFEGESFFE